MENSNEKVIGGQQTSTPSTEKIIGSDSTIQSSTQTSQNTKPAEDIPHDLPAILRNTTLQGGLIVIPDDFTAKQGSWKTIHSENPFEVLFLDYTQYAKVTDEILEKNYTILYAFWNEKSLLTGSAKDRAQDRYDKKTIIEAKGRLDAAKRKLNSKEGREIYFKEIDGKRKELGFRAITSFLEFALTDGEFTKDEGLYIIKEGKNNGLYENETRDYIYKTLNEKNFYPKTGLNNPDFLNNEWMTSVARQQKEARRIPDVFILDKKVGSLKEAGQVLFNNAGSAKTEYLHNANYIITDITKIESSGKAREYEKIINGEPDIDKRFLKVIYHLNPSLPFNINNQNFTNIEEVFATTSTDYSLFLLAAYEYEKGHLHIWLNETDALSASKLTPAYDYNSFLTFIFRINIHHGIYIDKEKFQTPELLITKSKTNLAYWHKIYEYMQNGVLPVWFSGIGRQDWIEEYNSHSQEFVDGFYTEEEKKLTSVQSLIQIIDDLVLDPEIKVNPVNISLLTIEGSKPVKEKIQLTLTNFGFVKAGLFLEQAVNGIQLNKDTSTFFSLTGHTSTDLLLEIDPFKLIKDKVYSVNIIVSTDYQKITIPAEIKVVFPKKAFIRQLIKYSLFGCVFFAIIRYVTGFMTDSSSWFSLNEYDSPYGYSNYLPHNYFAYFIGLILLIGGLTASVFLIRKIEKI